MPAPTASAISPCTRGVARCSSRTRRPSPDCTACPGDNGGSSEVSPPVVARVIPLICPSNSRGSGFWAARSAAASSARIVARPRAVVTSRVSSRSPTWYQRTSPRVASLRPARVTSLAGLPSASAISARLASRSCSVSRTRSSQGDRPQRSNTSSTRSTTIRASVVLVMHPWWRAARRAAMGTADHHRLRDPLGLLARSRVPSSAGRSTMALLACLGFSLRIPSASGGPPSSCTGARAPSHGDRVRPVAPRCRRWMRFPRSDREAAASRLRAACP